MKQEVMVYKVRISINVEPHSPIRQIRKEVVLSFKQA